MHNLSSKEVYENLAAKGEYEEAHWDNEEIRKVATMAREDFSFARQMKLQKNPSWRVIFNAYYDVFRELCDQLMRSKNQKCGNHQGIFAFMILRFPELDFGWELLEQIRTLRNDNKYRGVDISKEMWKNVEMPLELYISAVDKELQERLKL